ncbi:conserved membrane hypothetical protein [Nostocoides japonicum T1-X7]|uniref:TrbL/VirB6 plasmid conjugal transfer protein n=1 Tax=Nostocoides japonicum T1-X7 TaxID=1194083 RepID=A0A077M524_9MICO|nr:type IV secretion system protein [Tetrasphaera japonica]CCH79170.1 conserved membrane hypothetical protein [Tetrasphaera japonica T1-X7]
MDFLNPFTYLGSAAGKIVADGWTAAMLGLWNAGLWLLKLVLTLVDAFTVPDLSEGGPGSQVYQMTFWIAGALMLLLTMVQLAVTAARRDGKSMARVLVGTGQFVMVWAAWIALAVLVVAACGGLTRALMDKLLHIDKWAQFEPLGTQISTNDISDGTIATVLGFMGIFLVFAAIGHLLVMLTRAGALMVLATTTPIAAGGLVSDAGRSWFWKSLRWFIAAAFTPVVMILVLGIGVQMTSGVATGMNDDLQKAIGTAVPGVILICIGCFSPLALFKLLAFVDPGTSSGSALRAGLAAQGGFGGLLSGSGQGDAGSSAASTTDANGRSHAEASGEDSTSARFNVGARGLMGQVGGALGQAVGAGMGAMESIGSRGAAIGADLTNQMGVGHNNYVPDFSKTKSQSGRGQGGGNKAEDDNPEINGSGPSTSPDTGVPAPPIPQLPQGPTPGAPGGSPAGGSGPAAPGAAAGGEAGGAAAAGAVPIVPV